MEDDPTTVRDLAAACRQAIVANDVEAIAAVLASDWVLVDHDGVGSRDDFLSMVASEQLTHSVMELVPATERVRVHGDLAIVTSRVVNTARFGGSDHQADEWTTDVFVRRAGRWECVLSQATAARSDEGR